MGGGVRKGEGYMPVSWYVWYVCLNSSNKLYVRHTLVSPPSPDKTVHVVVKTPVMDFQQPLLLYSFIHIESCCDVMYVKDTLHIYL